MTEKRLQVANRNQRGMTLIELIVAVAILGLLSTLAVPLAAYKVKRDKERDLRYALREIRSAIDRYKDASDQQKIQVKVGTDGYPEDLDVLVKGVKLVGNATGANIKFLRRIPIDPMTGTADWGKRSSQDDPTSNSWGGQNVFDVYSKSMERARDGTPYSEWQ
ncbi:MAG TPA: type II secretion system protein [Bryobacteraceae bacterium]|jgi:general secretion pathway protein G|nr:type II secretion system protein [Bryobacteraceae bacterium]